MKKLRLIGDLHADHNAINDALQTCHHYDLTIQLGDFGAGFGAEAYLPLISPNTFKVLQGNHDNPTLLADFPHNLGRFGVFDLGDKKIFFVAGAWSIDVVLRTPNVNWWDNEQLSYKEAEDCLSLWENVCKDIDLVISHDGPDIFTKLIKKALPTKTFTASLLGELYNIHQPPLWRIGHWHRSIQAQIGDTHFKCLNLNEEEILEW
jgi:hypothetical protein